MSLVHGKNTIHGGWNCHHDSLFHCGETEKRKLGILSQRRREGGQASWDKIPSSADIFWIAPFSKARAPGRKASREERKREREKEEEEGRHFPRVVIP